VVLTRRGLAFNASDESSLGLLDGLQHIALYTNALTGPVPKWLLNLTSLNYVRFSANRLTGTVPTELGALTGLNYLYFDNNHLTGTIPTELGALTGLNYLDLALIASRVLYRRISGH
jgi:Leucine-rich repeat (LRR) protein